jgi:hypothetical protein
MTRGRAWISGAALAGMVLAAREAHADGKQECAAAYEQTQALRDAGKLGEARKSALACTAQECPGFIVKECTQWLTQIDASTPTVVFEVQDASGAETGAVQVSLDGKPWLTALDGKAKPLDPGPHTLRYTIAGAEPRDQAVQIREGEKDRKLAISFKKETVPVPVVGTPAGPQAATAPPPSRPIAPWVVGGVGVAGLVVGAVLGGITVHDYNVANDPSQCSPTKKMCTPAGASAESQGSTLGPATTAALVVGGAAVAAAGIWLGVGGSGKKPGSAMGLAVTVGSTAGGAGLRLGGTW